MARENEGDGEPTLISLRLTGSRDESSPIKSPEQIPSPWQQQRLAREMDAPPHLVVSFVEYSTGLPALPFGIIVEILSRLPVKTLLRFRCVCKSWNSLISDPYFVKKHLNHAKLDPNFTHHGVIVNCTRPHFLIKSCSIHSLLNRSAVKFEKLDYPALDDRNGIDCIVGSCNGLVCISDYVQRTVLLWNPTTKVSKKFPYTGFVPMGFTVFGFGYDCLSDDYKVVSLSSRPSREGYVNVFKVLSLKDNSWKKIHDFSYGVPCDDSGKFVSGALNWKAKQFDGSEFILSLDLATETYKELLQPAYEDLDYKKTSLGVWRECLCMLFNYPGSRVDVWVMKEYGVGESWTKLASVIYPENCWFSKVLCISKTGEMLLAFNSDLVLYKSKENAIKYRVTEEIHDLFQAEMYIESLVSPIAAN